VTAQRSDELTYRRRRYAVTAIDGDGLFDAESYGLDPEPISTGCYRGTICHYRVLRGRLLLDRLELGSRERPPALAGVEPRPGWVYRDLAVPIAFTGRILVGRGDVDDTPYLNMGFWPAWMYAEIHELSFGAGALTDASDVSADIATVRHGLGPDAARPAPGEPTEAWIRRTFSLTYAYSWPRKATGTEGAGH
jgi:hypothetical protein